MSESSKETELLFRPAKPEDGPAIRELVFSILGHYGLPTDAHTDADLDDLYGHYFSTGGDFRVLSTESGEIVGTVGLKAIGGGTVELRKMYLHDAHRGRRHGKRMLEWALNRARELGYKRMILETAAVLTEAIALYTSHGFKRFEAKQCSPRCDATYEIDL